MLLIYIDKFRGAYWSFGNPDNTMLLTVKKLNFAKFWGLNVKLTSDESKILPVMTAK